MKTRERRGMVRLAKEGEWRGRSRKGMEREVGKRGKNMGAMSEETGDRCVNANRNGNTIGRKGRTDKR